MNNGLSPAHSPAGALFSGGRGQAQPQQQMANNYASQAAAASAEMHRIQRPPSLGSPQYVGNPPPYKPTGYLYGSGGPASGSNFSSPRSSIGSYDSLVNPGPPPPYDVQRHGSPHSSGPSPRSSVSLDSKHSSPGTSVASNNSHQQIYDKLVAQRYVNQQGTLNELNSICENRPASHHANNVSLYNSYNETGVVPPPPPYPEHRMKALQNNSSPAHSSQFRTPQQENVNTNAATGNYAKQNHHVSPVHSANSIGNSSGRSGSSAGSQHAQSASMPAAFPSPSADSSSLKTAPQAPNSAMPNAAYNNVGLRYDVVPPKQNGPTDAERKLAALTEQLENDMRITSSASSPSARKGAEKPPPPPYHGPHITEPFPTSPPRVGPSYATSPTSPASSANSPSSLTVTSPLRTPLPMHVTPPQRKGPSEAEKKLEALTQELETQMERHPQGEYFGKCSQPTLFRCVAQPVVLVSIWMIQN